MGYQALLEHLLIGTFVIFQKNNCYFKQAFESHSERVNYLEHFISVFERLQMTEFPHAIVNKAASNMEFAVERKIPPKVFSVHYILAPAKLVKNISKLGKHENYF